MSDEEAKSASEVMADQTWLVDGAVPVSAIVLVAYIDPETGKEHLAYQRDDDCSVWKHIGMLQVCIDGYRDDCKRENDE